MMMMMMMMMMTTTIFQCLESCIYEDFCFTFVVNPVRILPEIFQGKFKVAPML
jgi:hypothetical protein